MRALAAKRNPDQARSAARARWARPEADRAAASAAMVAGRQAKRQQRRAQLGLNPNEQPKRRAKPAPTAPVPQAPSLADLAAQLPPDDPAE